MMGTCQDYINNHQSPAIKIDWRFRKITAIGPRWSWNQMLDFHHHCWKSFVNPRLGEGNEPGTRDRVVRLSTYTTSFKEELHMRPMHHREVTFRTQCISIEYLSWHNGGWTTTGHLWDAPCRQQACRHTRLHEEAWVGQVGQAPVYQDIDIFDDPRNLGCSKLSYVLIYTQL